ncbi:MAG: TolC family protein [Balneolaceae bacterium]
MKLPFLTALLSLFMAASVSAQYLDVQEAISTGLENNYNIQVFENRLEISKNNRSLGNAGFLPTVGASASRSESVEDSEFSAGGEQQTTSGARSTVTSASIELNWTLFDGLRMFRSYDLLGVLEEISDAELRFEVENLVREITLSYFDIVRIQNQIEVLENTVEVSLERIEIEETKLDLGSGSEVELLQARSDLNADRSALLRETNVLHEAKVQLNRLLARSPDQDFAVSDDIPIRYDLSEHELFEKTMLENSELDIVRMQQNAADLEMKQVQGERYPEVELGSGYRYNRNEAGGGFIRFNETTGFNVGITARINVFDGFNSSRRIQNAQVNRKNAELQMEESRLAVEAQFRTLFRTYSNNIELLELEQDNLSNAEETLEVALERFRLGTISSLELREAQRSFLEAENRLINAQFETKFAETELLRLSGEL